MLVAVAALVGLWLLERERRRSGLPSQTTDAAVVGVLGGLAGAKLVWAVEHAGRQGPVLELLLSRGGLSWYGGFAGGMAAGVAILRRHQVPIAPVLAAATPALAVAHAIGRVGCFLVGDDYGVPSDLPWAVAFPKGLPPTSVPVHPTQLYEAGFHLAMAGLLFGLQQRGLFRGQLIKIYILAYLGYRFLTEFIRPEPRLLVGLTAYQWAAVCLAPVFAWLWWRDSRAQAIQAVSM